jgi:hypothetical protein
MQITLDIPEAFAAQLIAAGKDPAREALEALAVEGYRTRQLNESEVRRMLSFDTRMEVHELLAAHDVCLHYTLADLETDAETSKYLQSLRKQDTAQKAG